MNLQKYLSKNTKHHPNLWTKFTMNDSNCRLCLKAGTGLLDIFSKDYEKMFEISVVIATHFSIQVEEVGTYSKYICEDCWLKIKEFHLFYCYVQSQQLNIKNREIEFITLKPEINISDTKIKTEFESTATTNLGDNIQPESLLLVQNLSVSSHSSDEEEDDIPIGRLIKLRNQDKCSSKSKDKSNISDILKKTSARSPHAHKEIQGSSELVCQICTKTYKNKITLKAHMKEHERPSRAQCHICEKWLSSQACLRNHIAFYHPSIEDLIFKCDHCPKSFARQAFLKRHLSNNHLSEEDKINICTVCNKICASKIRLRSHQLRHQNLEVMCEICAKIFKNKYNLRAHMREHEENAPKSQCDECGKWYASIAMVRIHKKHMHSISKEIYECDICNKITSSKRSLRSHKTTHSEKKFKCGICDKMFRRQLNLKEHLAIHSGEHLYSCQYCSQTFKNLTNMYAHRKKVHHKEWLEEKQKAYKQ